MRLDNNYHKLVPSYCSRIAENDFTDLRKDLHTVYIYIGLVKILQFLFASLAKEKSVQAILAFWAGGGGGGGPVSWYCFKLQGRSNA